MNKKNLLLILILFLGFVLRFWQIDAIPPGINRDEAALGFNAYSLSKTGKDEYGKPYPLSFKSFGDWKLPLYIYLDILPIKFLSLNELSVKLPSIIFGTATLIVVYFLVLKLFKDTDSKEFIAFIVIFLLSLSPWHIHFSRVSSEANLSVFLVSLGLLLFVKNYHSAILLLFSSTIFALSLYSYHGNHIFTPLLYLGLVVILVKNRVKKEAILAFLLPFLLLSTVIYKQTLFSADKTKLSGLTPLSDKYLVYDKLTLTRLDHFDVNSFFTKIYHNKFTFLLERFLEGYSRGFSPEFLFIKGGNNSQHNIPDFGNLYIWEAPFILLGLHFIFRKSFSWRGLLLYWFLIAPIPAAITRDAPHSARMLAFLPLPHIFAAVGFIEFVFFLKNKSAKYVGYIVAFLLVINFAIFADRYFIHFPHNMEADWGGGYKELTSVLPSLMGKYPEIIMDRPDYSPYIYFLFYQKVDPSIYQKQVIRYRENEEGFQHVKGIGNLSFKKLDWADDLIIPDRLLISWAEATPKNATRSSILVDKLMINSLEEKFGQSFGLQSGDQILNRLIKTIKLKSGQPQFYLIEVVKISEGSFIYETK